VEQISEFYFFYKNDEVKENDLEKIVSLDVRNQTIDKVLDQALKETGLHYKILDRYIVVSKNPISDGAMNSWVQQRPTVSGTVRNQQGEPIPGVTVLVKGTTVGTVTDINGRFAMVLPENATALVFSFVGMRQQEVPVEGRTLFEITLSEELRGIDEVVVIGYGTRQKKDLTGAVSQIGSEEILKKGAINPQMSMQGMMPGVFVGSTSSDPSARPTIRIRGVGTLGYNDPLYVIDGIPITEGYTGSDISSRQLTLRGDVNPLNMINPNDIESISVLKDASASAIYGLRASNGVVLITTKRSAKGGLRINVTSSMGIQNFPKQYEAASMADYVAWSLEAFNNRRLTDPNYAKDQYYSFFDSTNPQFLGNSPDYRQDWVDASMVKNALIQDHNISVSGGNEISNYAVGAGFSTQEQATYFKKLTRYSTFANSDHKITKWLKIGETIRLVYTNTDREPAGFGLNAVYTVPWQPFYDKTNTMGLAGLSAARLSGTVPSPFDPAYVNSLSGFALPGRYVQNYSVANNPYQFYAYGYGAASRSNFLAQAPYYDDVTGMFRTLGGAYAEFSPVKGLRIKGTLNIDYYIQKQESFTMIERALFESNNGRLTTYASQGNAYTYRPRENFNIVKEFLVGYDRTIGKSTFDLLFNASDQRHYWTATSLGIGTASPISDWDQRRIEEGWNPT